MTEEAQHHQNLKNGLVKEEVHLKDKMTKKVDKDRQEIKEE